MTAMTMPNSTSTLRDGGHDAFWKNGLAASLAIALHAVVLALLVSGWSVEPPVADKPLVLKTHLVMLPPAAQPEPEIPVAMAEPQPQVAEPLPAVVQPAPPIPLSEPAKPTVDPRLQAQKLEQAALARKRVEDKKREQQAERQQQLDTQKRNRESEEQRLVAQQQQQQQQAQQARMAAERARQAAQAAIDSRQYLPLSKEAPDYPQRALDKNIEGDCTVEYSVNPQGKVENPKVLDGCHPLFMRPSLAAANTFRYQPRTIDGQAVSVPAVRNTFHYRIK